MVPPLMLLIMSMDFTLEEPIAFMQIAPNSEWTTIINHSLQFLLFFTDSKEICFNQQLISPMQRTILIFLPLLYKKHYIIQAQIKYLLLLIKQIAQPQVQILKLLNLLKSRVFLIYSPRHKISANFSFWFGITLGCSLFGTILDFGDQSIFWSSISYQIWI